MVFDSLRFSLPQFLSLIGLTQAVYVLVYMGFRAGNLRSAVLPFAYFMILGGAFLLDFGQDFFLELENYDLFQWAFWFSGPPLSVLLILQIARAGQWPSLRESWIVLLSPTAFLLALLLSLPSNDCAFPGPCPLAREWLALTGLLAGLAAMMTLWPKRFVIRQSLSQTGGGERYWLILTLLFVNLFFLGFTLVLGLKAPASESLLIRSVLGIALVYLAGTSLFRIYPLAVPIKSETRSSELTENEAVSAQKMKNLIDLEKVYHEPAYSRTDLARELGIAEASASRLVNITYGRTFPQLISERRVADAQRLLVETDAPVRIVAEQVGFNSQASFKPGFSGIDRANTKRLQANC